MMTDDNNEGIIIHLCLGSELRKIALKLALLWTWCTRELVSSKIIKNATNFNHSYSDFHQQSNQN